MNDRTHDIVRGAVLAGGAAGLTSLAMLAARGRADHRSAVAPINATSHVLWGDRALRVDRPTVRHTLPGLLVHVASTAFWGAVQQGLFGTRRGLVPNTRNAALTSALAALVDLKLVPGRLTPGWERRLSTQSLVWVYGALAVGLAIGGELAARRGASSGASGGPQARAGSSSHSARRIEAQADAIDDEADAQVSTVITPNQDLAADGKPDVDTPRNPNL